MPVSSGLSRSRVLVGLFFVIAGVVPIAHGLGLADGFASDYPPGPPWVQVCSGISFIFAGIALTVHRTGFSDGSVSDRRTAQPMVLLLVAASVGSLICVAAWVLLRAVWR